MDFQNKEAVLAPEVSAEVSPSIAPQDLEQQPDNEPRLSIHTSAFRSLGILDQFLALWIFLAMLTGILLGNFVPSTGPTLQKGEFVGVSIPIVPPDTDGIQLGLAWAFLPDEPGLRDGLILVGIARCIAMVLIWTGLAGGDNEYCAILVAINSLLQMVLFAPLALLFINVISQSSEGVNVDYAPVAKSVGVFLGIPLAAAIVTRFSLRNLVGQDWYEKRFLKWIGPLSLIGLLFTIIVLFGSQGRRVVHQIVSVVRVAAPLIVYFAVIFLSTLVITRRLNFGYRLACTQSFTAASNNFELAIAVAIATYGVNSDQALAATVGPLIEVPVLLGLVYAVKWFGKRKNWTA
ncbi:Arsenite resistance protein ArsB [Fonsecaea pedrosoi]|nr:Arsenite resistance protein ArsB [Fonsecaea pedrosoi]